MSGWLLDTNVLSALRKGIPPAVLTGWLRQVSETEIFLSVVTLAEIRFGIERVSDVGKRTQLREWLEDVRRYFQDRVLPLSEDVILRWRVMVDEGRRIGITHSQPDALIAATALTYRCGVVTRDVRGFERTGVALFDPWNSDGPPALRY